MRPTETKAPDVASKLNPTRMESSAPTQSRLDLWIAGCLLEFGANIRDGFASGINNVIGAVLFCDRKLFVSPGERHNRGS
jgi:hypothetical protein